MRYIIIDNHMNESLSFRKILTKVTFVTTSLMLDSTCFVLGLPFGTFILAHVFAKRHFKDFVALPEILEFSVETRLSDFDRHASMLLLLDS
jgi:hypothetical protein